MLQDMLKQRYINKKNLAPLAGHEQLDTGYNRVLLSEKMQPPLSQVFAQWFSLAQYSVQQCIASYVALLEQHNYHLQCMVQQWRSYVPDIIIQKSQTW